MNRIPRQNKSLPGRDMLQSLQISPANRDVNIFGVADGGRLHAMNLHHNSAAANQFVRNVFGGQSSSNALQCADQSEQPFLKYGVDRPAPLDSLPDKLLKCQHQADLPEFRNC